MIKRTYEINAAAMTMLEAERIAFDPPYTWPAESLDKAAKILTELAPQGRDRAAYVQLAKLKASLQRIKRAVVKASKDSDHLIIAAGLCDAAADVS